MKIHAFLFHKGEKNAKQTDFCFKGAHSFMIVIFKKTHFNQKTEQKTGSRSLWVPFVPDSSFQESTFHERQLAWGLGQRWAQSIESETHKKQLWPCVGKLQLGQIP